MMMKFLIEYYIVLERCSVIRFVGKSGDVAQVFSGGMENNATGDGPSSEYVEPITVNDTFSFGGIRGFEPGVQLRQMYTNDREGYQRVVDELRKLGDNIVGDVISENFDTASRYVTDVVWFRNSDEGDRIQQKLHQYGETGRRKLFMWVREPTHFHVIHDCLYSNNSCRCSWKKEECIRQR